jgi:uncharacterized protein YjiS (DUF1127 family)
MSAISSSAVACPHPAPSRRGLKALLAKFTLARTARRQRDRLIDMDPYLLDDIGLTPRMAEEEASRPFWDVPEHWKR